MNIFGRNIRFIDAMLAVNVFIYLAGLGFSAKDGSFNMVTRTFAMIPPLVASQPWRILTSIFVHSNLTHLVTNMLALYFFGMYVERILTEKQLIRIYFIGGLCGSLMYLALAYLGIFTSWNASVVGSSGALFAIGGALAYLRPNMQMYIFPFPVPLPMWAAEALIFFFTATIPNVAWQGHLGGLIAGVILAKRYKKKANARHEGVYFTTRQY